MNPNGNLLKSSNSEPFRDTKGKMDMTKEITGYSGSIDTRTHAEYKKPWADSQMSRRGSYAQKPLTRTRQEYRVLRDNRNIQKASIDVTQESLQNLSEDNHQAASTVVEKRNLIDQQQLGSRNSDDHMQSQDLKQQGASCPSHGIYTKPSGNDEPSSPEEIQMTASNTTVMVPGEVVDHFRANCASTASANSVSSSSDPVHVPSAVTVGAIQREIGVVGGRRKPFNCTTVHASLSSNSFAGPLLEKDISASIETLGQSTTTSRSNYANSFPTSDRSLQSVSVSRSFAAHQYNIKLHQQVGHQKVKHPNVEWKPKPTKKPTTSHGEIGTAPIASSCVDSSTRSSHMQMAGLSENILQANVSSDEQVIIPHHLQVSESERTGLTFGSFGAELNSTSGIASASQAFGTVKRSGQQTSSSMPASVPVGSNKDLAAVEPDVINSLARTTSDSPTPAPKHDLALNVNDESVSPRDIESYPDIGLVQSHNLSYNSPRAHQLQNSPNLPSFSAYEPQMRFGMPFSGTMVDDYAQGQGFSSTPQALNSHVASGTLVSSIPTIQQQQQQQQPIPQFYPQVSHYPNFLSYRPIYSPIYPPMAMPIYSNNPTFSQPSNGSNYFVMPPGSSHLATSGVKYTSSQYKSVHNGGPTTGFGNYANPGGYTVGTPRAIGTSTGFEDAGRIKYKDHNLYVEDPQNETTDIWIQSSTELANLQSASYYSLPGQVAGPPGAHPAFLPAAAHTGHPSFGSVAVAAQPSHVQYANLYHPGAIPGPTGHLVHQQAVPGLGPNAGVGAAAATALVGAYPQNQIGHFGWTSNF